MSKLFVLDNVSKILNRLPECVSFTFHLSLFWLQFPKAAPPPCFRKMGEATTQWDLQLVVVPNWRTGKQQARDRNNGLNCLHQPPTLLHSLCALSSVCSTWTAPRRTSWRWTQREKAIPLWQLPGKEQAGQSGVGVVLYTFLHNQIGSEILVYLLI